MKMIRLEGMLLKKPFLILLLMSAALIPAVSLLAGIVSVEARYLITSAVFLLLMAAALLRRALYVEAHHRMEPFMPVDVHWHLLSKRADPAAGLVGRLDAMRVSLMSAAADRRGNADPLRIDHGGLHRSSAGLDDERLSAHH